MDMASVFETLRRRFLPMRKPVATDECRTPEMAEVAAASVPVRISAVELLRQDPELTAAELAQRAGVTISYASMLVRRRKPRPVGVTTVRPFGSPAAALQEAQARDRIQQAAASGLSVDRIAEQLRIVPGEVEFVLKIARLSKKN